MDAAIIEVGPRDGLQNEKQQLNTQIKVNLINRLADTGLLTIEAGAFVSPKAVPQMKGSAEILEQVLLSNPQCHYPVLVPNMKGFEAAQAAGAREIAVFTAASNSFTKANINATINESIERFKPVVQAALKNNIKVRGYVSCIAHCPYEGFTKPKQVIEVCKTLIDAGCYQISLGDTTGRGTSKYIKSLLQELLPIVPADLLAGHFHDTYGQAISNISTALEMGVCSFDSSVAGLGGCPYAPGASGNVATEDLVYLLQSYGYCKEVNLTKLAETGRWISETLKRPYTAKAGLATLAACS
ncbi:MAG: hydroxymethylglutaryl-CoA lyase [Pseudomonadota bacterium]|nr:hydroxymethylglutaryl-CoA lyase [Gammaproteobacteria bacterium]MEC8009726.1 hydroxymethylglutaryl-CoA lyase [Pseudomonadota bacterium]HBF07804.1 hydroxymethylglutaryl-CoA lyase [Gammaproteobacteria bacterium]|tara:strand:+ start:1384 stop:2280 length:897 start_codon:yes stop_codon:yes gene_type:complete